MTRICEVQEVAIQPGHWISPEDASCVYCNDCKFDGLLFDPRGYGVISPAEHKRNRDTIGYGAECESCGNRITPVNSYREIKAVAIYEYTTAKIF